MIRVRKSGDRGRTKTSWLDSYHTFSFGGYDDSRYRGFRDLLVINDDRVQPSSGFGEHDHENMEIISYVLEGTLAHKDSTGKRSTLTYGDVQRMSAGTGVTHSEYNPSNETLVHFLQIWILPNKEGIAPSHEEKVFSREDKLNRQQLIASPDGNDGSLHINQDALIFATILEEGKTVTHIIESGRHTWIQVAGGSLYLNGIQMNTGDGAAISGERELNLSAQRTSEILIFNLR